jgi:hypothetical protein
MRFKSDHIIKLFLIIVLAPTASCHGKGAVKVSLVTEYPLANSESLLALYIHLLNFEIWSLIKIRRQLED